METPIGFEPTLVLPPFPVTFIFVRSEGGYGAIKFWRGTPVTLWFLKVLQTRALISDPFPNN